MHTNTFKMNFSNILDEFELYFCLTKVCFYEQKMATICLRRIKLHKRITGWCLNLNRFIEMNCSNKLNRGNGLDFPVHMMPWKRDALLD